MKEKEIVYSIILDVWNLFKKYGFGQLSYEQWEQFFAEGRKLREKHKVHGKDMDMLFRDMFGAIQMYYIQKNGGEADESRKERLRQEGS